MRRWLIAVCLVAASLLAGVQASAALGAQGMRILAGQTPSVVTQGSAVLAGIHPQTSMLELNVDLPVRESAALDRLIAQASTPGSPRYGDYLTQAQYKARFAPTAAQVAAVKAWLKSGGLRVTGVARDRLFVSATASTAYVERAFGVAIDDYTEAGRQFYANDRDPSVPANLPVDGVDGLSDALVFKPQTNCLTPEEVITEAKCGLTGADFRSLYEISGSGEGQTIGFTLWGNPQGTSQEELTQADFDAYAAATETTPLTIGAAGDDGLEFVQVGTGSPYKEGAGEIALDTMTAHAIAPRIHETYWLAVQPSNTELEETLDAAANSDVAVISSSWGSEERHCEDEGRELPGWEAALQHGAATGKTFYFSSGDDGASRGCNYPALSPYVVAVGGTALTATESFSIKSEVAMEDDGGCSNSAARPAWQTGIGSTLQWPSTACSGRAIPDVSADSDYGGRGTKEVFFEPKEGVLWTGGYATGTYSGTLYGGPWGGTSLAAPIWAASSVLWNANNASEGRPGIGFSAPLIYALGNDPNTYHRDFHDITEGSNGFPAHEGWDEATGWGSLDFQAISHNPAALEYTGQTSGDYGQPVTLSANLRDQGTTEGLAGRTVTFTLGNESCQNSTSTSGSASCSVPIADNQGEYVVTVAFAGDAAYSPVTITVPFTIAASCADNSGTITLKPGLTETPTVQVMKVKGKLSECPGEQFTSATYTASLTTGEVTCAALGVSGAEGSGAVGFKWTPKAKKTTGSLTMPLTETAAESPFSGKLERGPFSPGQLSGTVSESYANAAACGVPKGRKGVVKPITKGTFTGSAATFE